jgi:hypothetical protein
MRKAKAKRGTKRPKVSIQVLVPQEVIERRIFLIRGQKVMLDSDLAHLYQVETRALVQAIKRNLDRFPEEFMFQLTAQEASGMRSQIVIASQRNVRHQPYAFTEHGALMLSAVLKSKRASEISLHIVRVFVRLREMVSSNQDLALEVEKLRSEQQNHGQKLDHIFVILDDLVAPPLDLPKRSIGFPAASRSSNAVADRTIPQVANLKRTKAMARASANA